MALVVTVAAGHAATHPGLSAPFMNKAFVAAGGRRISFTLSLWEPYNVFWYSADLVRT